MQPGRNIDDEVERIGTGIAQNANPLVLQTPDNCTKEQTGFVVRYANDKAESGDKMTDYSNHLYGSIVILRIANFEEFCRYKPTRVKKIRTVRGEIYVLKSYARNRQRYWLWACGACKRRGIVRADTLGLWVDNGHQCKCRACKAHKVCRYCGSTKPIDKIHWYINKHGYADSYCIPCRKAYQQRRYDDKVLWGKVR